jgi:hypothetical protein
MRARNIGLIILLGVALIGIGIPVMMGAETDVQYQYEVKSEQIETDAGYNGTATNINDLPQSQQEALFKAYKESDHFLGGGAGVQIETDEPLELTQDEKWRVIEIEGVRVLVGMSGPEKEHEPEGNAGIFGFTLVIVGAFIVIGSTLVLSEELES